MIAMEVNDVIVPLCILTQLLKAQDEQDVCSNAFRMVEPEIRTGAFCGRPTARRRVGGVDRTAARPVVASKARLNNSRGCSA